jgi:hypothetical protein
MSVSVVSVRFEAFGRRILSGFFYGVVVGCCEGKIDEKVAERPAISLFNARKNMPNKF